MYATSSNITTLTKQTLMSMTSTYIQTTVAIEQNPHKQTVDIPEVWKTITGIQSYNTVSGKWE